MMPGIDPSKEGAQKPEIDVAKAHVAEARDQRQRNGVRDVGADELRWREPVGIEIHEHHDAERPGADRREGDQKAQKRPGGHGQPRLRALESVGRVRAQPLAQTVKPSLEQHRHARQR